jgi:hypothetical protein
MSKEVEEVKQRKEKRYRMRSFQQGDVFSLTGGDAQSCATKLKRKKEEEEEECERQQKMKEEHKRKG